MSDTPPALAAPSDEFLARFLSLHPKLIDLTLDRMHDVLARLGHPETRLPPVIHVAGTNGKGSTVAFLRAMLEASGRSVHVYTSPHLVRFHERIRLAGALVEETRLVEAFARCEAANAGAPITLFEMTTAAALLLFAEVPADVLLLEVGLGGRMDATNVIERPALGVITPVSIDHRDFLGETLAEIAGEKAGILKPGVPAVIARQEETALAVIERHAARIGAPLKVGGQDFAVHEEQGRLVYQDLDGLLDLPRPRLVGRHQFENAATAIAALRCLFGASFPQAAIERGLIEVHWPARMQRLGQGELARIAPKGAEVWLDGGHNVAGGQAIAATLADLEDQAQKPLILIVGMLSSKETDAFLKPFAGLARELYAVDVPGQQASRSAVEVAAIARDAGLTAATAGSVPETLRFLAGRNWPEPPRILICGSLYLAGEVLRLDGARL